VRPLSSSARDLAGRKALRAEPEACSAVNLTPAVGASDETADVTARVETDGRGPLAALLEVAIAPTPLTSDESIA